MKSCYHEDEFIRLMHMTDDAESWLPKVMFVRRQRHQTDACNEGRLLFMKLLSPETLFLLFLAGLYNELRKFKTQILRVFHKPEYRSNLNSYSTHTHTHTHPNTSQPTYQVLPSFLEPLPRSSEPTLHTRTNTHQPKCRPPPTSSPSLTQP